MCAAATNRACLLLPAAKKATAIIYERLPVKLLLAVCLNDRSTAFGLRQLHDDDDVAAAAAVAVAASLFRFRARERVHHPNRVKAIAAKLGEF